jgi:hypothetical protein
MTCHRIFSFLLDFSLLCGLSLVQVWRQLQYSILRDQHESHAAIMYKKNDLCGKNKKAVHLRSNRRTKCHKPDKAQKTILFAYLRRISPNKRKQFRPNIGLAKTGIGVAER